MTVHAFWAAMRDRITEDLLARRSDRWLTGLIAVLLVALGFVAGRWTGFTSRATPIVFQEAPGGSSEASPEELRALVVEKETVKGTTESREAPRAAERAQGPGPKAQGPARGAFVASAKGEKYYHPDCAEVRRIKAENKIWFESEEEAKESGYEPSACILKGRQERQ